MMCNTDDISKLLNISLPSPSINDIFNQSITQFILWFKANNTAL